MATGHEKRKPQQPQIDKQLEATEEQNKLVENPRKDKFADFLIDVSKYVFTGVIITSLFNDVTDRTFLYILGMIIVFVTLLLGLRLTNNRKDK